MHVNSWLALVGVLVSLVVGTGLEAPAHAARPVDLVQYIHAVSLDTERLTTSELPRKALKDTCPNCITFDDVRYFDNVWDVLAYMPQVCGRAQPGDDFAARAEGRWSYADCGRISAQVTELRKGQLRPVVTEFRAETLFHFMRLQRERALKIPFDYADDGCYARAHYMAHLLTILGWQSRKVFIFNGRDDLVVRDRWQPNHTITWWYHVAPLITVRLKNGRTEERVIDPSLADAPLSFTAWAAIMGQTSCKLEPSTATFANEGCAYTKTDSSVYAPAGGGAGAIRWSADDDLEETQRVMADYMRVVLAREHATH